jgi:hypothetical protein
MAVAAAPGGTTTGAEAKGKHSVSTFQIAVWAMLWLGLPHRNGAMATSAAAGRWLSARFPGVEPDRPFSYPVAKFFADRQRGFLSRLGIVRGIGIAGLRAILWPAPRRRRYVDRTGSRHDRDKN